MDINIPLAASNSPFGADWLPLVFDQSGWGILAILVFLFLFGIIVPRKSMVDIIDTHKEREQDLLHRLEEEHERNDRLQRTLEELIPQAEASANIIHHLYEITHKNKRSEES